MVFSQWGTGSGLIASGILEVVLLAGGIAALLAVFVFRRNLGAEQSSIAELSDTKTWESHAVVQFAQTLKTANALAAIVALLVLAAICVIALFASGALMSAGKLDYGLMLTIHRIAPAVLIVAMALVVYLFGKQP